MEKIVPKDSDPKILGAGILSCIRGVDLLGESGEVLSKTLGLDQIEADKKYSYKIRALIIEEVLLSYGEIGTYALGLGMSDGFKMPLMTKLLSTKRRVERDIKLKKISDEKGLNIFLKAHTNFMHATTKNVFDWRQSDQGIRLEKVDDHTYKVHIVGLFLLRHWSVLRGAWTELLMRYISNNWDIEFTLLDDQSRSLRHGAHFVGRMAFKKNRKQSDSFAIAERHNHQITKEFVKVILEVSDQKKNQIEQISKKISKYIPPQIHDALFSGDYDTKITTRRKKLTIFFSDIANFTSTSEGLQPEDLTKYLNEYFSEMTTIALSYGATIDKYIGDAMMAFFGDPDSKGERNDARACVSMAVDMQKRLRTLQKKWRSEGFSDPFQVRMGINTGYCNVGNFGSEQRLTYTIIGGEVNVAQRLEVSADPNGILMSYETYAHAQDMVEVEEREAINMKGINRKIKIFSIIHRKDQEKIKDSHIKDKFTESESSQLEQLKKDMQVMNEKIEMILKKI